MWEVVVGRSGESNGGKMGTTVIEEQLKIIKNQNHFIEN